MASMSPLRLWSPLCAASMICLGIVGCVGGESSSSAVSEAGADGTGGTDAAGGSDATGTDANGTMDAPGSSDGGDGASSSGLLTLSQASIWVPQGGSTPLPFTLAWTGAGVPLTLHASGLPAGVTAADVPLAATDTSGSVTFAAASMATQGATAVVTLALLDGTTQLDSKTVSVLVTGAPGSPDLTFNGGTSGERTLTVHDPMTPTMPGNSTAQRLALYPPTAGANAGKILVAGTVSTTPFDSSYFDYFVARFNPDGSIDTTFGEVAGSARSGYVLYNPGPASTATYVTGVAPDSMGRVIVYATHETPSAQCNVDVVRFTASGDTGLAFASSMQIFAAASVETQRRWPFGPATRSPSWASGTFPTARSGPSSTSSIRTGRPTRRSRGRSHSAVPRHNVCRWA